MLNKLQNLLGRRSPKPAPSPASSSPPAPLILDVTDSDFSVVVEASKLPVVVDVWAEWCQPCQVMSAYVGFLAQEFAGRVLVVALDADENPETCQRFNVLGLPTLLFVKNGMEVDRSIGVEDYQLLKQRVQQIVEDSRKQDGAMESVHAND